MLLTVLSMSCLTSHAGLRFGLTYGHGTDKFGKMLGGGRNKDKDETVIIQTANNGRLVLLRSDLLRYAYFIKADDPALEWQVWDEYE